MRRSLRHQAGQDRKTRLVLPQQSHVLMLSSLRYVAIRCCQSHGPSASSRRRGAAWEITHDAWRVPSAAKVYTVKPTTHRRAWLGAGGLLTLAEIPLLDRVQISIGREEGQKKIQAVIHSPARHPALAGGCPGQSAEHGADGESSPASSHPDWTADRDFIARHWAALAVLRLAWSAGCHCIVPRRPSPPAHNGVMWSTIQLGRVRAAARGRARLSLELANCCCRSRRRLGRCHQDQ